MHPGALGAWLIADGEALSEKDAETLLEAEEDDAADEEE